MKHTSDVAGLPSTGRAEPLVKIAKSSDTFRETICPETGEIQRFQRDLRRNEYVAENEPTNARFNRFALQGAARNLLPGHRVKACVRRITNVNGDVAILRSQTNDKCHFGGLQTCGSVWACPVCAAKISERRKLEVRQALDTHLAAGGGLEMITLTFPHARTDVLASLMAQLREAMRILKASRPYRNIRKMFEPLGSIRALEVTWGEANGWHPHFHEVWFFPQPLTVAQRRSVKNLMFSGWSAACVAVGFPAPNRKRGVHIQPAESAADYIAKFGNEPRWEAASELTKQHVKKSRDSKGRTPFDLLRDYADGNKRAGALFAEYVDAFFGFRQLFWSKGLKAAFGIDQMTDEEIAAAQDDKAKLVCRLQVDDWKRILRMAFDARATVLSLAENGGFEAVQRFVSGLTGPEFYVAPIGAFAGPPPLHPVPEQKTRRQLKASQMRLI